MTDSTWGLAMDGSRARVVQDLEKETKGFPLPEELGLEVEPHWPGEIMSDRPGQGHTSVGASRSALEHAPDPVLEARRDFCEEVLWFLGSHLRRGDFSRLVVAAEPRMLGLLRDRRNGVIAAAIVNEAPKDYLHLTASDLRARLRELVPNSLV